MTAQFFQRRTIWWPTWLGWAGLAFLVGVPCTIWFAAGERFLSRTQRQPADVLVVEGWVGSEGIKAAKAEFLQGGYHYIVATGALTGNRWDPTRWSAAFEAEQLLLRLGVPREQVILATPQEVKSHRTFASSIAVWDTLQRRGLQPKSVNVFTFGPHAMRSHLVYRKVLPAEIAVGVISWTPSGYNDGAWWQSSNRALDLIKESLGCIFEAALNSGRTSNSAVQPAS